MADLLWDDVSRLFDPAETGPLPDLWTFQYSEGTTVLPPPRAEVVLSRPADAEQPHLEVRPVADMLAIFRFHAPEEIDFDVDLRETQGSGATRRPLRFPRRDRPVAAIRYSGSTSKRTASC